MHFRIRPGCRVEIRSSTNRGGRGEGRDSTISRRYAPELCVGVSLEKKRAQGMPGAWRTRSLVCKGGKHTSSHHRHAETVRHSLCNGLAAASCSPRSAGLVSLRRLARSSLARLGASVGVSGPHDFAVRPTSLVSRCQGVHRIPLPTSVTIAIRTLCPEILAECANGRLDQNRPLLELSP